MFTFLSKFIQQWDAKFLYLNDVCCAENQCYTYPCEDPLFTLNVNLRSGWYMIEMGIRSPVVRVESLVFFNSDGQGETFTPLKFSLYSERVSKRLIYLTTSGRLSIGLRLSASNFELKHFRFVRVTQNFARSRLLKKLKAKHPHYRALQRQQGHGLFITDNAFHHSTSTQTLWADYCSLFEDKDDIVAYPRWIQKFDYLTDETRKLMRFKLNASEIKPLISILMPVYNPNPVWLEQAIESVRQQIYPNWELCIADDASSDPYVHSMLRHYAEIDGRINLLFRQNNGHISEASNSALSLVKGEWVALLDHDDLLAEHALFWVVEALNKNQSIRLLYSDEDKIDETGNRSDPYFKCDWNQDLFYSHNLISHLGVYHTNLVHEVGGFRGGFEGSQDYDLALRCIEKISPNQICHIPRVLYHWRIHIDSTSYSLYTKPYALVAGERAINEHLARQGVDAKATSTNVGGYRVKYALPLCLPLVSLILLTRNKFCLLRQCIESILQKTTYPNYEIIVVDNGSDDPETLNYLKKISKNPKIRVLRDDRPFNYSALNNAAVQLSKGEIIGLINNDVEVITPEWLAELVSHALRPEVGAVGARLWYPDDTLQHGGIVLGLHGVVGHAQRYLPKGDCGYHGRAALIQSFSAITGACMLVRKALYEVVGGLNETSLQVTCNDVDFCLRLREAGYRTIWTPYAELYHHESATRGVDETPENMERTAKEISYMKEHWGDLLQNDPAYSPNLTLDFEDFSLAWPPRVELITTDSAN
ncbi:Glycosyltransferase, GT2 family [Trichlorobacter thiogenes]|uniref:Glycosyltransferase, GT2 family n=1 Tax=Trichlorobacter thiogenes TaxID=115783 RepID=A0A1T4QHC6_9BACT|nr:glycosyltransferase family 2 protein [Trichlorobacter thiogenes]SKA03193.1 Glycosyltransferase, GT2 family [Trichlorobacter thiogenes]